MEDLAPKEKKGGSGEGPVEVKKHHVKRASSHMSLKTAAHIVMALNKRFRALDNVDTAQAVKNDRPMGNGDGAVLRVVMTGGPCGGRSFAFLSFSLSLNSLDISLYIGFLTHL